MRHDRLPAVRGGSLLARKRVQLAGTLCIVALLPWLMRAPLPGKMFEPASINTLAANGWAVLIAFWMRLSIEVYPGIRRSSVILPITLTSHAIPWLLRADPRPVRSPRSGRRTRSAYRLALCLYHYTQRGFAAALQSFRSAGSGALTHIGEVDWFTLARPRLHDARRCDAIVADFSADLPDEWEAFLADAALAGRIVYQIKQLSESLTGKVELEQLSENSFGSLLPARGYFHLKALLDFLFAVAILPVALPVMIAIGIAIRFDSPGPMLFRQSRIGHAGKRITIYKFRTMHSVEIADERQAAMTSDGDDRITRVGRILRKLRIDELPQIFNILKWEMSWIGPRPEAEVLSVWYTSEIPFYRYRHVVKPGISGWAQVNQGHVAEVDEVHRKLQFDFYYIKYFSPSLDLLILLRTIKTMLTGWGAR